MADLHLQTSEDIRGVSLDLTVPWAGGGGAWGWGWFPKSIVFEHQTWTVTGEPLCGLSQSPGAPKIHEGIKTSQGCGRAAGDTEAQQSCSLGGPCPSRRLNQGWGGKALHQELPW